MKKRILATIVATLMVATMLTACSNKTTDTTETPTPTSSADVEETTTTPEVTEEPTITEESTTNVDPADFGHDGRIITAEGIYNGSVPIALFDYTYRDEKHNIITDGYPVVGFAPIDSSICNWPLLDMTNAETLFDSCKNYFGEPEPVEYFDGDYRFESHYEAPDGIGRADYRIYYYSTGKIEVWAYCYHAPDITDTTNIDPTTLQIDESTLVVDIDKLNYIYKDDDYLGEEQEYNFVTNPYDYGGGEQYIPLGVGRFVWGTFDTAEVSSFDYLEHISAILGAPILVDGTEATWVLADNAVLVASPFEIYVTFR